MKKSVAITISDERLAALEMYLEQKNIKLSDEIDKCIDGLYQKNVPQNVRNFIEMKSEKKVEKLFACRNGKAVRAVTSHSSHRVAPCGEVRRSVG